MAVSDNLKRGSVDILLLTLLKEEDMYGYQISRELARRSDGRYKILESSMYLILYRMEDKGFISKHREQVGKRKIRMYYHIEDVGRAYLEEALKEYLSTMGGVLQILGKRIEDNET